MKNLMSSDITTIQPLYLSITGGAGVVKLFLTKIQSLTKTFSYKISFSDKPKVLLLAPTGVAAVTTDETTIYSALHITVGYFGKNLPDLSNKMKKFKK